MKTIHELNDDILNITMKIKSHHPELLKYMTEMPETNPDETDPEINRKALHSYYESLKDILITYSNNSPSNPI